MSILFIFMLYFAFYITFEVLFNAIARLFGAYDTIAGKRNKWTLEGSCSVYVGIMGGLVGVLLFLIRLIPIFDYVWSIVVYCILSGITITAAELGAGLLLNVKLKLKLWDYSNEWKNYRGQISVPRSIGWTLLGVVIWLLNTWIIELSWRF